MTSTTGTPDRDWPAESFQNTIRLEWDVSSQDISRIIRSVGSNKAPREDALSNSFLKACKEGALAKVLAKITSACFTLEHFPRRFRAALVVVLRKPGKTVEQQKEAGAYRPISLLSSVGKVIEAALTERLVRAAEGHHILPNMQMGFRQKRSTEVVVRVVTDAVRTA
jgi:hypothetical protein